MTLHRNGHNCDTHPWVTVILEISGFRFNKTKSKFWKDFKIDDKNETCSSTSLKKLNENIQKLIHNCLFPWHSLKTIGYCTRLCTVATSCRILSILYMMLMQVRKCLLKSKTGVYIQRKMAWSDQRSGSRIWGHGASDWRTGSRI